MIENRETASDINKEKLKESLDIIETLFGKEWLNDPDNHPLKKLWAKKDIMSTNELYIIGSSLLTIKDIDERWTNVTINNIKEGGHNNVIGFLFEIVAAAIFHNSHQKIIFPHQSNPGYDLIAKFDDGGKMNISCKTHGISSHNKYFNEQSQEIEEIFISLCEKFKFNNIECFIANMTDSHAEYNDYYQLKRQLSLLIKDFDGKNKLHAVVFDKWLVNIYPLKHENFSEKRLNYIFVMKSNFHRNEHSNLYDKFEKACDNFSRHAPTQTDNEINILFINIPEHVNMIPCKKWAKEYLDNHPEKPISGIFFIQNCVARDPENKEALITTTINISINDHYKKWLSSGENRTLNGKLVVSGDINEKTPEYMFRLGNKIIESSGDMAHPNECYFYQHGHSYNKIEKNNPFKIGSEAPGIHNHMIICEEWDHSIRKKYLCMKKSACIEISLNIPQFENFALL